MEENLYEFTRDNIIAEQVDADEQALHQSQKFNRGTELTVIRGAYPWGNIKGLEYSSVQVGNHYFNIPAPVLANSIMPKRS